MAFTIDTLPEEVLHNVFLYLKVPDKLNAALVCKKWLNLLNSKSLLQDIKVLIRDNNTVPLFEQSSRNFLNFKFKMILIDSRYYELFEHFSSYIEYLSFQRCDIWRREPVRFDLNFNNLKVLESLDCDSWSLFPSVPNLTELHLSGSSTITDDGLAFLQRTMKHLKTLKLDSYFSFDKKVIGRYYSGTTSYETCPTSSILSLPAVASFISERASTLKELMFHNSMSPIALIEITKIKNLSLHKMKFSCPECDDIFLDLLRYQPHLKILNVSGSCIMNQDVIKKLCVILSNIEELFLNFFELGTESLNSVLDLQRLKKLTFISRLSEKNPKTLKYTPNHHLSYLDISNTRFQCIDSLVGMFSNLVFLNLSNCGIDDFTVHLISSKLLKLRHLYMNKTAVSDYGLTGVKSIQEHEVRFGNSTISISPASLSNLKCLNYLKLNECKSITKLGLKEAIHFPYLEYLNICGCDVDESTLGILIRQNPSIRQIFCDNVRIDNFQNKVVYVKPNPVVNEFYVWPRFLHRRL